MTETILQSLQGACVRLAEDGFPDPFYMTFEEVEDFCHRVVCSSWWRDRSDVVRIAVKRTQKDGVEIAWTDGESEITFGPQGLSKTCALHELAHVMDRGELNDHGAKFQRAYVTLAKRYYPEYGRHLERKLL